MKNKWIKIGIIFSPDKTIDWMQSHAQLPVVDHLSGSLFRVYFASRDINNYSSIGSFIINLEYPRNIISMTKKPLLTPGPIGCFDEHGVFPSSIITYGKKKYLYYIGWNKGYKEPLFYSSIGIAQSDDGGMTFQKVFNHPIIARGPFDPCLVTSPCVFKVRKKWQMVYVSGFRWKKEKDSLQSYYDLKYAHSKDGIQWQRDGNPAISLSSSVETNIGRASVIKDKNRYKMWFCYAGKKPYRIGYAESINGMDWIRNDKKAKIDVSKKGFDDKMIAYPYVFIHNCIKYMLYNGNDNGRTGIGMAYLNNE